MEVTNEMGVIVTFAQLRNRPRKPKLFKLG